MIIHVGVFFFRAPFDWLTLADVFFARRTVDVFGVPLNETVLRAPATAILGGYRHDLPLVVFLCVEELYRTGESRTSVLLFYSNNTLNKHRKVYTRAGYSATYPIVNDTTSYERYSTPRQPSARA